MKKITAASHILQPGRFDAQLIQGDSNSTRLCFAVNRFCGPADLAECSCLIKTQNSEGKFDLILPELEVEENTVTVVWTITSATTRVAGQLVAQIQFERVEESQSTVVWQSKKMAFEVLESLDAADEIHDASPTLFQQWEQRVNESYRATQTGVQSVTKLAEETAEQAQQAQTSAGSAQQQAALAAGEAAKAVQLNSQTQTLLSSQPRQFFVKTLAERDALQNLRQCDRCDVAEEQATYLYDTLDTDGNLISPEWILVSRWDALQSVSWDTVTGKPAFAAVAVSGQYADLLGRPARYDPLLVLQNGSWDFALSDKAVMTVEEDTPIEISNVQSGAVGLIKVYGGQLILPENSKKSADFDYLSPLPGQHYEYTFVYDGLDFTWNRAVYD